ncbi:MAG: electron transfer flavoprotein subunit alpha/FixB family protein [Beijerinckiaceae bacterium]
MASILVYCEIRRGQCTAQSFELIAKARALARTLGAAVDALLIGEEKIETPLLGADRVLRVSAPCLKSYNPQLYNRVVADVIKKTDPVLVLMPNSTIGIDLGAASARATRRNIVCYVVGLELSADGVDAECLVYGGRLVGKAAIAFPAIAVCNPNSMSAPSIATDRAPEVVDWPAPADTSTAFSVVDIVMPSADDVDLSRASKIVSVGRGIGGEDGVARAQKLAALMSAELAASRAVVDNGWLSRSRQVGKSGSTVKPDLYFAIGISGAPEHCEGMSQSKFIVAVNRDAKAPIFDIAHLGTTCDLEDLVPALIEKLAEAGR